jgi:hypothetical protein
MAQSLFQNLLEIDIKEEARQTKDIHENDRADQANTQRKPASVTGKDP